MPRTRAKSAERDPEAKKTEDESKDLADEISQFGESWRGNEFGNPKQSAVRSLIEKHYLIAEPMFEWDWPRLAKLCDRLRMTPDELAALIMMRPVDLRRAILSGHYSGPVRLHLTLLECYLMSGTFGTIRVFPDLGEIAEVTASRTKKKPNDRRKNSR